MTFWSQARQSRSTHSLKAVLTQLEESGIKLKRNKCSFLLLSVEYLVHRTAPQPMEFTQHQRRWKLSRRYPHQRMYHNANPFWE